MAPRTTQAKTPSMWQMALAQVAVSVAIGLAAAIVAAIFGPVWLAPMVGWDAAALVYLGWTWRTIGHLDAAATAGHATTPDATRRGSDLLLLSASVASLIAVGIVAVHTTHAHGLAKALQTVLGIVSIVIAWLVVHTTYTMRYASLHHGDEPGGVNFNGNSAPRYSDFAYVAFTIGMTFQVSDTSLTSSTMRTTALRHALLSYLFGTVIIAASINIVAGLAR
jgi:uncharacterized membrane protein